MSTHFQLCMQGKIEEFCNVPATGSHLGYLLFKYFRIVKSSITHLPRLIIGITVVEHSLKIFDCFLSTRVDIILQVFLDRSHIHGPLYDLMVVLKKHRQN